MDVRRVTAKGGPLHRKTFDVPVSMSKFPAAGGVYRVTEKQATWEPAGQVERAPQAEIPEAG